MITYFENFNVKLYVLYILKTREISCQSEVVYYLIYKLIFLCIIFDNKNSKFKELSNDIAIDISSFWNFANTEDLRRKRNPMMDSPKFTSNKKILSWVVILIYNQVCC